MFISSDALRLFLIKSVVWFYQHWIFALGSMLSGKTKLDQRFKLCLDVSSYIFRFSIWQIKNTKTLFSFLVMLMLLSFPVTVLKVNKSQHYRTVDRNKA
jgi:hypothetical protein